MINKITRILNVVIFRWYELTTHKDKNVETSGDFSYNICMHKLIFYQTYNLVHNILELYNVLIQTRLTTSKTKRDI